MKILEDGIIEVGSVYEIKEAIQSLSHTDSNDIKIRIRNYIDKYDVSRLTKYLNENKSCFDNVSFLDLSSAVDLAFELSFYCENVQKIILPAFKDDSFTALCSKLKGNKNLKMLSCSNLGILKSGVGLDGVEELSIQCGGRNMTFLVDDEKELKSITSKDLSEWKNLNTLSLMLVGKLNTIDLTDLQLEKLSLVGNKNLQHIVFDDNLGNLKELRVYTNNDNNDFNAERIVKIIKANFEGKNKLQKFVFDLYEYPKVTKMLEKELKNPEFKYLFDNLVSCGEYLEGRAVNEIDAKRMEIYDKAMTNIVKTCGVQKDDCDFIAFAKIYLFLIRNLSYNNKSVDNGNADKFYSLACKAGNVKYPEQTMRVLGNGYNIGTAFGFLTNGFAPICTGYTRATKYLLRKVGITAQHESVFRGSASEIKNNKNEAIKRKRINHAILKIKVGGAYVYADPTFDTAYYKNGLGKLTIFDDERRNDEIDVWVSSKYHKPPVQLLSMQGKNELYNAFECVNNSIGKGVLQTDGFAHSKCLKDWCLTDDYTASNTTIKEPKNRQEIDEFIK